MGAENWFGDLQLAYKAAIIFVGMLVVVLAAGFIKLFFDRRKLKKLIKKEELEAGPKEDTVELNQREKDEGDLFGIRAIEAGFYAGVAQSRPTSRAGSVVGHPGMSTSTLVGGVNSPLMKGHSNNNSVLSLNLGQSNERRKSPPTMKLRPSEAELTGKHGAVDMSLQVPPSPGVPRGSAAQTFGNTDDSSSDGFTSTRSMSPRSADFQPQHYAPAPKIPMPDALQVTYHTGDDNNAQSQVASFNSTPGQSPTPPSPGNPPVARLPTLPTTALRKDSRSPSPETYQPRVRVEHPTTEPFPSSSSGAAQTQHPAATHKRLESDASSTYSQNRLSAYQSYQAYQDRESTVFSGTNDSRGTSMALSDNDGRQPSMFLAAPGGGAQDSRLSEFYDAYYRNSQVGPVQAVDAKRMVGRHSTIVEVDTPLASPMFPKNGQPYSQTGVAL